MPVEPTEQYRRERATDQHRRPDSRGPSSSYRGSDSDQRREQREQREQQRGKDDPYSRSRLSAAEHGRERGRDSAAEPGYGDPDRRDGESRRDDSRARGREPVRGQQRPLPPPPGRPHTPVQKDRADVREEREAPGSNPRKGGTPSIGNPFLAEVLKVSKQKYSARPADEDSGAAADDEEAGEIPSEVPRKRKHAPIVWNATAKKAALSTDDDLGAVGLSQPASIYDRVAQEAAEFKQRQIELGFDPQAPAAMKASPSVSGSSSGSQGDQDQPDVMQGNGNGNHAALEDDMADDDMADHDAVSTKGLTSRWLTAADDEEGTVPGAHGTAAGDTAGQAAGGKQMYDEGSGDERSQPAWHSSPLPGAARQPPARQAFRALHDMRNECRTMDLFEVIEKISEGTYGVVSKAREKATGREVALKRIKLEKERDGFPVTSVREINILLNLHHPNIVNVDEIVVGRRGSDQVCMVMEYMDHDLKSLMEDKNLLSRPFSVAEVKCLMLQLLRGIKYLHDNWVLHRDLKTSNILYNCYGELKLCDFGMARQYGIPLGFYTPVVCTLWYRAPELLFGAKKYSTAVDIWSVGCVMGELLTGKPMFPGQGELDYIDKMLQLLGTPTDADWPGLKSLPNYNNLRLKQYPCQLRARFSTGALNMGGAALTEAGHDLLSKLLAWDPERRISAAEALESRWFTEAPQPQKQEFMPMFKPRKAG